MPLSQKFGTHKPRKVSGTDHEPLPWGLLVDIPAWTGWQSPHTRLISSSTNSRTSGTLFERTIPSPQPRQ